MTRRSQAQLDHLVVTAPSLESGIKWVEGILGVTMQAGGAHPRMGTHNALLRLGDSAYLEVLAIDPAAPPAGRPRWFELDRVSPGSPPRLATWVARTHDVRKSVMECRLDSVSVESMSRGAHEWLITLAPDGSLWRGGTLPYLIEWTRGPHPADRLADRGCSLSRLEVHSPDAPALTASLECLGLAQDTSIEVHQAATVHLVAHVYTPHGTRTIAGR